MKDRDSRSRRRATAIVAVLMSLGAVAYGDAQPASAVTGPFATKLKLPPVLTSQNIAIDIAQTDVQLRPGAKTTMWTYNGSYPGPTIRRPSGTPTYVTFDNHLPVSQTIHHHGNHSPSADDGQPADYLIAPGTARTYTYPLVENGGPERGATQWYHDHSMMVTGRNVAKGLFGMFILDDPTEASIPLPKGEFDVPLAVTDTTLDANNQIVYAFDENGSFGDLAMVNGTIQPYFEVADRKYRFRILNASNAREYTFALSNGQPMIQVGTESGLLPAPVSRTSIILGPAERADVVIDFAGQLGQKIVLRNTQGETAALSDLMQFRVKTHKTDTSRVPAALRPLPALGTPSLTRSFIFDSYFDDSGARIWTIDGEEFDPNSFLARPRLGATEQWVFRNLTNQTHYVHIHDVDQQLVSRNGGPPPPYELMKETWRLPPFESIVVRLQFTDNTGAYVFHCHLLEHEDQAMMNQFNVVAA